MVVDQLDWWLLLLAILLLAGMLATLLLGGEHLLHGYGSSNPRSGQARENRQLA